MPDAALPAAAQSPTGRAGLTFVDDGFSSAPATVMWRGPTHAGRTAVIVPSKDGGSCIGQTVGSADRQAPVFVVSDGSTDDTVDRAAAAGAIVLVLPRNVGKANATRALLDHRFDELDGQRLVEAFEHLVVVDDDTVLAPDFVPRVEQALDDPGVAVAEGIALVAIPESKRWNAWLLGQAACYFWVALIAKRLQGFLRCRTWINGAASAFRSTVLDTVVQRDNWTVTEDCDWCWLIHRRHLGSIRFLPGAVSYIQCPSSLGDLYRQWLRWTWGGFQVVRRRRVGLGFARADVAWWVLAWRTILDVLVYAAIALLVVRGEVLALRDVVLFTAVYGGAVGVVGAIRMRNWRVALFGWMSLPLNVLWAVAYVHGLLKAVVRPRTQRVAWVSPTRYDAPGITG